MDAETKNEQSAAEATPETAAQPETEGSGVKAIQIRSSNGQTRTQFRDAQGKIVRAPGKPQTFEARHTKGRQKFLDARYKKTEELPDHATNAQALDHFAMRIIERAANGDSKLGSAAASLTKRFDERSAGLPARSELDRGANNSQPIVVVITPPDLMHKEIVPLGHKPPVRPSWQLPEPGIYEPEPTPLPIAEILEIREDPEEPKE
jgi:hypothetical protein